MYLVIARWGGILGSPLSPPHTEGWGGASPYCWARKGVPAPHMACSGQEGHGCLITAPHVASSDTGGGGAFSLLLGGVKVLTLQGGGAPPGGSESPAFPCGPCGGEHSSSPLGPDQPHPTGVGGFTAWVTRVGSGWRRVVAIHQCPVLLGGVVVPLLILWSEQLLLSVFFCVSWHFLFVAFFGSFKNTCSRKKKSPGNTLPWGSLDSEVPASLPPSTFQSHLQCVVCAVSRVLIVLARNRQVMPAPSSRKPSPRRFISWFCF